MIITTRGENPNLPLSQALNQRLFIVQFRSWQTDTDLSAAVEVAPANGKRLAICWSRGVSMIVRYQSEINLEIADHLAVIAP